MELRRLGRSNVTIAPMMLGGNVFGWTADLKASFALMDAFIDAGFNAIDTADAYSRWVTGHVGGESETVIGQWLAERGHRDRVVVATKVGVVAHTGAGSTPHDYELNLRADHIVEAVEASLRRLRSDYIDLYQAHSDDLNTPLAETLEAHTRLVKAGKVRAVGASNHSPERLAEALQVSEAHGLERYDSLQPLYNLYDRGRYEGALQKVCVGNRVSVICLTSLAKGFLTGKYRDEGQIAKSVWSERLAGYQTDRGRRILVALDTVASELDATMGQVALAWLLAQPGVAAPIVAADDLDQLEEALDAVRLKLSEAQLDALTRASDLEPVGA